MKYTIEFELPDNETVKKQIKYCPVHWQIWGYCGDTIAKPKADIEADTPQTESWYKFSSDCDLWQKDSTCIGCYRYDICKQAYADTLQTERSE